MIYVDNMNTTYQDIITTFVLNIMLHHVGMLWIIENNEQLKYDADIQHVPAWSKGFDEILWYIS